MLETYKKLLAEFELQNVNYTLWKSLEFYSEQLNGEGDIDVLFKQSQIKIAESIMMELGYAEDLSSPDRIGRKIKVFRGFDIETLKHSTVHVHYGCWFGSKKYKEFCFPYSQEMFEFSIREQGVLRLCPAHFIVTRILIVALRKNYEDMYVCKMAKDFKSLPGNQRLIVEEHLFNYFKTNISDLMKKIEEIGPSVLDEVHQKAYEVLNEQNNIESACQDVMRYNYSKTLKDWYLPNLIKGKRNKISNPVSIILAGHDGVGKTTVSRMLKKHLAKISMTKRIYLGRSTWSLFNSLINKFRQKQLFRFLNLIWPFTSSIEIVLRLLVGRMLVKLGVIVIFDRSLTDFFIKWGGSNKFGSWFPIWLAKKFTHNKEADLCFLLHANSAVVLSRKGKNIHSIDEIENLKFLYDKYTADYFKHIETSNKLPEEIVGQIIDNVFRLSAKLQGKL